MRVSEKWGGDVDAAVELALKELKLTIDEVDVEVLEESSKGFLGIGSKLAKVRVTAREEKSNKKEKSSFDDIDRILASLPENQKVEVPEEIREDYDKFEQEEMEDARASAKAKKKDRHKSRNNRGNRRKEHKENRADSSMFADLKNLEPAEGHPVETFLRDVTTEMGIDLDFTVKSGNGIVYVNITGKDTGTIIGKRGQTLDAIQYLASIVANKESDEYVRVILDAENYRSKRERTLMNLANRLAGKVERSGRSITLEPMNPYERKVIHSTLQEHPYVTTRSEGKEPYRRVIIEKK